MTMRQIKKQHWEETYQQITTLGRTAPLSMQYDIDITCNGVDYILKVQPEKKCKITILQAVAAFDNTAHPDGKEYFLINNGLVLSSLLEIVLYQSTQWRK